MSAAAPRKPAPATERDGTPATRAIASGERIGITLTDPRQMRAVAHPTRMRLIGLLRSDGPMTATHLLDREPHETTPPAPTRQTLRAMTLVFVSDVDAAAARAVALDGRLIDGPADMPWGLRQAVVADPEGHLWELTAHLSDVPLNAWEPSPPAHHDQVEPTTRVTSLEPVAGALRPVIGRGSTTGGRLQCGAGAGRPPGPGRFGLSGGSCAIATQTPGPGWRTGPVGTD